MKKIKEKDDRASLRWNEEVNGRKFCSIFDISEGFPPKTCVNLSLLIHGNYLDLFANMVFLKHKSQGSKNTRNL